MKKKEVKKSRSETDTLRIAETFARTLRGGEVILLVGDLGAGKSTFVRGMAQAFGVEEPVRSPTFTLMNVHRIKKSSKIKHLVHVDAYRLKDVHDLRAIGIEEYIGRDDAIVAIEWPERVVGIELMATNIRTVTLTHCDNGDERIVIIFYDNETK